MQERNAKVLRMGTYSLVEELICMLNSGNLCNIVEYKSSTEQPSIIFMSIGIPTTIKKLKFIKSLKVQIKAKSQLK